jgi:two-component system, LuxR family, response regulator FixJ
MSQVGPVYVVVENSIERRAIGAVLGPKGFACSPYLEGRSFLEDIGFLSPGCVLLDVSDRAGLDVIASLGARLSHFPVLAMGSGAGVPVAVRSMKLGACDFLEKPLQTASLVEALDGAFSALSTRIRAHDQRTFARARLDALCPRERDVLRGLVRGQSNKALAFELGLGVRTVETYRASMLDRLGVKTLSAALLLVYQADDDVGAALPEARRCGVG